MVVRLANETAAQVLKVHRTVTAGLFHFIWACIFGNRMVLHADTSAAQDAACKVLT